MIEDEDTREEEPTGFHFRITTLPEDVARQYAAFPTLPEECPACGKIECRCAAPDGEVISEQWFACSWPRDNATVGDFYKTRATAEQDARRRGWEYVCREVFTDGWEGEDYFEPETVLTEFFRLGEPYPY